MTKAKSSGEESRSKPDGASGRNTKGNTPKKMGTFRKTFMIYGITNRDERTSILFHAKKRRSAKFAKV
ncbi:hypothetical protein FH5T_19330 [Draconibacterium orientale]|jgi:hypothetical protein|uniref:Uncharacterized protein n=1 Tax=Draconibacterium orientale TaxID=1168034 RepID=A0ABM5QFH3_9BACT|nr:hypothetical protein FH5T_19330 [Draconibacterium orientale]